MHIINTLVPVFSIIAVGIWLRKAGFFSAEFAAGLSRLVYWVALPCLLFYKIATAPYDYQIAGKTFIVVLFGMISCIAVAYIVALLIRIPGPDIGTFVQGAFRGNLAYIGLPVIIYSFSNSGKFNIAEMEAIAVLVLALIVPVYNAAAVVVLLASQHKFDRYVPGKIFRQIMTNPLFISCVLGIIYSLIFSRLPVFITRTFSAIGQISLPLALLCIGATLAQEKVAGQLRFAFITSLIKIAVAPAVGFLFAVLLGLGQGQTRIALLFLACPTAVASYILTDQLGGNRALAAKIIVISAVLSILSMSAVIGFF